MTPLTPKSSVIPARIFSVTRRSPLTNVDTAPWLVTTPPTATLTPPSIVLLQLALSCCASTPEVTSTPQPLLWLSPSEMEEEETGSRSERPHGPTAQMPERSTNDPVTCSKMRRPRVRVNCGGPARFLMGMLRVTKLGAGHVSGNNTWTGRTTTHLSGSGVYVDLKASARGRSIVVPTYRDWA